MSRWATDTIESDSVPDRGRTHTDILMAYLLLLLSSIQACAALHGSSSKKQEQQKQRTTQSGSKGRRRRRRKKKEFRKRNIIIGNPGCCLPPTEERERKKTLSRWLPIDRCICVCLYSITDCVRRRQLFSRVVGPCFTMSSSFVSRERDK